MIAISSDADRIAWRQKYLRYSGALTRAQGEELQEFVRVTNLCWHKAHQEGLEDAIGLVLMLAEGRDRAEREAMTAIADALEGLRAKNDDDMLRIYGLGPYRPAEAA